MLLYNNVLIPDLKFFPAPVDNDKDNMTQAE
jgi:hypothetical protein